MFLVAVASAFLSIGAAELPSWTFDADEQGWKANTYLKNVAVKDGFLTADTVGFDPFFSIGGLNIEASPWQYLVISLKASSAGQGELFWTGDSSGPYGGFTQSKTTRFSVPGGDAVQDVVLFPFWGPEGVIRQLRLDLYGDAHFEIDSIRVMSWGGDAAPVEGAFSWDFAGDLSAWRVHPAAAEFFAPPLNLDIAKKGWVCVTVKSDTGGSGSILWANGGAAGMQSSDFTIEAAEFPKTYLIQMDGNANWRNPLVAFGVRLSGEHVRLDNIAISEKPLGAPDLNVSYLGAQDALNRTGATVRVLAQVTNRGGSKSEPCVARLALSPDLRFGAGSKSEQPVPGLEHGETVSFTWTVTSPVANTHKLYLKVGNSKMSEGSLLISKSLLLSKEDYVPTPIPVRTNADLLAYYFPGWNTDEKWDCIRNVAPIRHPALGYYDESKPECVDWQIKWAVENGITGFLVDWYWVNGSQSLTQWFDAYRKARYRDMLKVAIMWANHNPPGTHSLEDWRAVTQHWIDNYFNLPAYYKIDGKPAVFIWAPSNIRDDLHGSAGVKQCIDESQNMAKAAGYPGINFVVVNGNYSSDGVKTLLDEGYNGITNYHEWGANSSRGEALKRLPYKTVVEGVEEAWNKKNDAAGSLTYYPVVDTGWDSRPWHGNSALVINGRTPELFEALLAKAKMFAGEKNKKIIVLGPVNEWGEGSYIEPCLEYGFSMLEAIRSVFGGGSPKRWPVNVGPNDIGLGPYDFPVRPTYDSWTFDHDACGWRPMMGVADFACGDGVIRFKTVSEDPAVMTDSCGLQVSGFTKVIVTMQLTGTLPEGAQGQLFWSCDANSPSENSSVSFPLIVDGQSHEYAIDLSANPTWKGKLTSLRLDPCSINGVQVVVDAIRLGR